MRFSKSFILHALIGILLINSTIALVVNQPQVYDQGNKHFLPFVTDWRQDGSIQSRPEPISLADLIVAVCVPKRPSFVRPFLWNQLFPLKDCPASQCVSPLVCSIMELSLISSPVLSEGSMWHWCRILCIRINHLHGQFHHWNKSADRHPIDILPLWGRCSHSYQYSLEQNHVLFIEDQFHRDCSLRLVADDVSRKRMWRHNMDDLWGAQQKMGWQCVFKFIWPGYGQYCQWDICLVSMVEREWQRMGTLSHSTDAT